MFLFYILLSSLNNAFGNLFIRKSIDCEPSKGGDPFLVHRFLASTLIVAIVTIWDDGIFSFTPQMALLGVVAGLQIGTLMWLTGHAIKAGPSALSFAFINSATIAPPIIMASLFGEAFGHIYTISNAIGALLVVAGLFWMAKKPGGGAINKKWVKWILLTFCVHAVFLAFFQWRVLLLDENTPTSPLLPFHISSKGADSFVFWMSLTATLFQWARQWLTEHQHPTWSRQAITWGMGGGILNGLGGYFTMRSTEVAFTATEKALTFPLYCVLLIFFCNLWGRYFYKEPIHWPASVLCFIGIFLGML